MDVETNSDVDLKNVESILNMTYMKMTKYSLRFLGGWPSKLLGEKESKSKYISKIHILHFGVIGLPSMLLYIKRHIREMDFFDVGLSYITCCFNIFSTLRLFLTLRTCYGKIVVDFIHKLHLFHHKDRSEYAMSTHLKIHRLSLLYTIYVNIVIFVGVIIYNVTPMYKNIKTGAYKNYKTENVTFEHSVNYEFPFDVDQNVLGYSFTFLLNWFYCYLCSSCTLTFDLLMSLMIFNIYGHILIMIYNIENFRKPSSEFNTDGTETLMYSKDEMKLVACDLRNIIIHHQLITESIDKMTETFGYTLFLNYLCYLVVGSLLLLECSRLDVEALGLYGMMTFGFLQQIIQVSVIFELLGISSDKLCDVIYCIPWELMDTTNRKTVAMMFIYSQKSLSIKALNIIPVGVQTMVSVLKTSFSYFIMLKTFTGAEN